jgi:transcriptional regulator with XRE-family HTH domain
MEESPFAEKSRISAVKLPKKLRAIRFSLLRMPQEDIAYHLGVSQDGLSKRESGKSKFSIEELLRFVELFEAATKKKDLKLDWLLRDMGKAPKGLVEEP